MRALRSVSGNKEETLAFAVAAKFLPPDRDRRLQPDADRAALVDVGALGGDAPDEMLLLRDMLGWSSWLPIRRHLDPWVRGEGPPWVEWGSGAAAVGRACLFPPLSSGGALVARP
jgi:hypothetical protein